MDVFAGEAQGRIEEFSQQNLVCLLISSCTVLDFSCVSPPCTPCSTIVILHACQPFPPGPSSQSWFIVQVEMTGMTLQCKDATACKDSS